MERFDRTANANYEEKKRTKTAFSDENEFNVHLRVTKDQCA